MNTLYIIGAGMGSPNLLTQEALSAIMDCEILYAFDRVGAALSSLRDDIQCTDYQGIFLKLGQQHSGPVGVLCSGDVGFFSIATAISGKFSGSYKLIYICGISSVQYFCAKLCLPYQDMEIISLHGRTGSILGSVAYNKYTFALTGGENPPNKILQQMYIHGLGHIAASVGQELSSPGERIVSGRVDELKDMSFKEPAVLLLTNPEFQNKSATVFDNMMKRGSSPMTKQEVRWTTLAYMDIDKTDTVYDIGAGTGSVSIEMARRACFGTVHAIEKDRDSFELLCENRRRLGAYNVLPYLGRAGMLLDDLPAPDKVFIGGSGRELANLIPRLLRKNPELKIVINAVTLETLGEAQRVFAENGLEFEAACINAACSKPIGGYHMMMANNPVYVISSLKRN